MQLTKPMTINQFSKLCIYTISAIYLVFGIPKLFNNLSPAQGLIGYYFRDISLMLNFDGAIFSKLIGVMEIVIGVGILFKSKLFAKITLFHMLGTFLTFVFAWDKLFSNNFLTIEGQYVFKNVFIVLICYFLISNESIKKQHLD